MNAADLILLTEISSEEDSSDSDDAYSASTKRKPKAKRKSRSPVPRTTGSTAKRAKTTTAAAAAAAATKSALPHTSNALAEATKLLEATDEMEQAFGRRVSSSTAVSDGSESTCAVCNVGGDLICCDGAACTRVYHQRCVPQVRFFEFIIFSLYCMSEYFIILML
jgi:hypothetical protein